MELWKTLCGRCTWLVEKLVKTHEVKGESSRKDERVVGTVMGCSE